MTDGVVTGTRKLLSICVYYRKGSICRVLLGVFRFASDHVKSVYGILHFFFNILSWTYLWRTKLYDWICCQIKTWIYRTKLFYTYSRSHNYCHLRCYANHIAFMEVQWTIFEKVLVTVPKFSGFLSVLGSTSIILEVLSDHRAAKGDVTKSVGK